MSAVLAIVGGIVAMLVILSAIGWWVPQSG